ncbi:hypothetical protein Ancab_032691 [Ancistrocladus abbreviatus]
MARWSDLKDGSGVNCVETVSEIDWFDNGDACVKRGVEDSEDKVRELFDQVLMVLLRGVYAKSGVRPIPVLLGDGRAMDLFKLFCLVRERGGFDSVSKEKLWGVIAEKFGLDFRVSGSLKLIYFKYLDELDQWLNRISRDRTLRNGTLRNGSYDCGGNLGLLSLELEKRFRDLSEDGKEQEKKDGKIKPVDFDEIGEHIDVAHKDSVKFHRKGKQTKMSENITKTIIDDDEKICLDGKDDGKPNSNIAESETNFRKRKRDMFSGMLNWLNQVAKNPSDPSIGRIPGPSKWKENESKEFWSWALLAREATLRRRNVDSTEEHSPAQQKKLKMHPSMYEDLVVPNHQPVEGLRFSKRLPSMVKTSTCPCCNSCSDKHAKLASPKAKLETHPKAKLETHPKKLVPVKTESEGTKPAACSSGDDYPVEKHVLLGAEFQAEVPVWTGVIPESDSKWLGTKTWPPDNQNQNALVVVEPPGKGRYESCDCPRPTSVECIRFHIAEKRMKLKLELGTTFYQWKFNQMGEEVSLSWSAGEEQKFKQVMRTNPPFLGKSYFPKKTWKDLVSYYFNVFLLRRRIYQNRVTPRDVNSDDDESDFGSLGEAFGHLAVKASGPSFLPCSLNEQCTDLE